MFDEANALIREAKWAEERRAQWMRPCADCGTEVDTSLFGRSEVDAEVSCADCLPARRRVHAERLGWELSSLSWRMQHKREGVPPRYGHAVVSDIEPALRGFDLRSDSIYLWGSTGTGKTHAIAALAREALILSAINAPAADDRWYEVESPPRWVNVPALLEQLRRSFDDRAMNPTQGLDTTPVLILDDLGAEKPSEWVRERIYTLVNERYERRLPLVVTSNLPPSGLAARVGQRVASRLAEMCQSIELAGKDRRVAS